jgi:hypothetical protein
VGASTPPRRSPERGNVHGACGESSGHTNRSRQNFLGNDCVLRAKVRGHRDVVTVVGHAATIAAGEWITASGEWVNDRTHGQQFKARFLRTSAPTSADGIEKCLSSGMIRGVGPVLAKKLVRAFGEKVFDVIETNRRDRAGSRRKHSWRLGRAEGGAGNHGLPAQPRLLARRGQCGFSVDRSDCEQRKHDGSGRRDED